MMTNVKEIENDYTNELFGSLTDRMNKYRGRCAGQETLY